VIAYRAVVDVPRELVGYVSRLLGAQRRRRGTRKKTRALTTWRQALFSAVEPGNTHDLIAAHQHALGALYAAAAHGLPTLADPGYAGAGIGVHTPFKQPADGRRLGIDNRTYNKLLRSLRCQGERGFALLVGRWRVLQHVTASPNRIGDLANAALVLTQFEHHYICGSSTRSR
jgi:hypothetical protein